MSATKSTAPPLDLHPLGSTRPRRRLVALLCALTLWLPACSYAIIGDAPLIPLLLALPLLIAIALPRSMPVTGRSIIYTVVVAAIVTVILQQVYKVDPDRFYMPMVPSELVIPFFLGIGAGLCFMVQSSHSLSLVMVLSVMVMMMQGTCLNDPVGNLRLPVKGTIWSDRYVTYGIFVSLTVLVLLPLLHAAQPLRLITARPADRHPRSRQAWLAVSMVLLIFFSAVLGLAMPPLFRLLENWSAPWLASYMQRRSNPQIFGDSVNLNETIGLKDAIHANKVVFRARSPIPPGYLRGRVYTSYLNGRWHGLPMETPVPAIPLDSDLAVHRYLIEPGLPENHPLPAQRVDIFPSERFRSNVLFLPGSTQLVDTISSRLLCDANGSVGPRDWDRQGGYTAYVRQLSQIDAWSHPKAGQLPPDSYLAVPDELRPTLEHLAGTILGRDPIAPADAMRQVAWWLQNNCEYQLGVALPADTDPVIAFLTILKRGHCEFYASAAALILRARGIPARYVTGFICMERHPLDGFWMARFDDAHAWVEAYDADLDTWVLVEATTASAVPAGAARGSWTDRLFEALRAHWEPVYSLIRRGYFADAVLSVLSATLGSLLWLFRDGPWFVGWGLLGLGLFVLARRWRRHRLVSGRRTPQPHAELTQLYALLDRLLRRYRIQRQPQTSIRDLIQALQQPDSPAPPALAPLLREYEMLRYNPDPPGESAVQDLTRQVQALLRHPDRPPPPTPAATP